MQTLADYLAVFAVGVMGAMVTVGCVCSLLDHFSKRRPRGHPRHPHRDSRR
jgi:hypothetical protein